MGYTPRKGGSHQTNEVMMEIFIIWSGIFIILNCLDVVSTYSGMGNLSSKEMEERELNPLMAKIIPNRMLFWGGKMGMVTTILVILFNYTGVYAVFALQYLSIFMALVVINNVHATWAERHQKLSLGKFFIKKLHVPKAVAFTLLVGSISLLSGGVVFICFSANLSTPY